MKPWAVSVVIPTYNRATLVPRAMRSALAAIRPGDEVIVVDDGSTDGTEEALAPYGAQIRYLRGANGGPGAARNRGLQEARQRLIACLDSDDEWMPDKLELQRALMPARPDIVFCFSDFAHRDRRGGEHHAYLVRWHQNPRGWDEILGSGFPFSSIAPLPAGRTDFLVYIGDLYPAEMAADYVCTSNLVVRRDLAGAALRFSAVPGQALSRTPARSVSGPASNRRLPRCGRV